MDYSVDLIWESDWIGYEVGFDHLSVVGLYRVKDTEVYVYIDTETGSIIDIWKLEEDE